MSPGNLSHYEPEQPKEGNNNFMCTVFGCKFRFKKEKTIGLITTSISECVRCKDQIGTTSFELVMNIKDVETL